MLNLDSSKPTVDELELDEDDEEEVLVVELLGDVVELLGDAVKGSVDCVKLGDLVGSTLPSRPGVSPSGTSFFPFFYLSELSEKEDDDHCTNVMKGGRDD